MSCTLLATARFSSSPITLHLNTRKTYTMADKDKTGELS